MNVRKGTDAWYFLAFFFILAFAYFFWFGNYILFFQEQQSLFLYTSSYLSDFLLKPGGFLDLAGEFLTQFYVSKFAGSLILALILSLPGIILLRAGRRLMPGVILSGLLLMIPCCLLFLMQTHYYHLMMYNIGFLLVLLYFLLSVLTEKKAVRYAVLALFPLFYYLSGAYALIYIGLFILYCLFHVKGPEKYYYLLELAAGALISVFVFNKIFLLQSIKQLFLYPLPFINDPAHKVFFYALAGFIILYPVIYFL